MIITFISDTHNKHKQVPELPGGDLLIHSGDSTSRGYAGEIESFCKWFDSIPNYKHKIFIAGNHDWGFQNNRDRIDDILAKYPDITYLQDSFCVYVNEEGTESAKIYGSPWQPEFHNWAFNLPRNGESLKAKWEIIPDDTDILVTHGPPYDILDKAYGNPMPLGCELLAAAAAKKKPKIHVFGHIHGGYGYKYVDGTNYINAAVLNDNYEMVNKPVTIEWYPTTNEIDFI